MQGNCEGFRTNARTHTKPCSEGKRKGKARDWGVGVLVGLWVCVLRGWGCTRISRSFSASYGKKSCVSKSLGKVDH
ncbi:hypothetical protein L228DRAFT_180278 [Xylona heveae TC161]|uniref:Uncharacterized protein n=1 Tax=Xylona heveae (strain CBS 132557 / TC161) TaxID=1328760 RepID=A0A165FCV4_XYLHT|nr:hypothetical protein L228DRAFT_180278 [Xylona heveae TC161]KZF20833.1 hypothetical protein L228DRAFT_180278 [Xylona heveae TC161]